MRQPDQLVRSSLELYVPVLNIGKEQTAGLSGKLLDRHGPSVNPKDVRRVLRPAANPRANILLAEEVVNFHERLGLGWVEPEQLEDMRAYMASVLRIHFDDQPVGGVDTLPAHMDEEDGGLVLSIAGSEKVLSSRGVAQAALGAYHRVRRISPEVWVSADDELVTRVHLAESSGPASNDLLRPLYVEINSSDTLLEASTELGAAKAVPTQSAG